MTGNDWFPLHFDRLRKSKWWRRASDLSRARNVMLWGEAYKSVPAGSLPDDDDELAEAAGFGMDVDGFLAVKDEIMAPWVLCSDGRWYHPTVCEVVLDTWERASERRRKAAEKKASQRARTRGQAVKTGDVPAGNAAVPEDIGNVPGDNGEKAGDIRTQRAGRQDRTYTPLPPRGEAGLFELGPGKPEPPDDVEAALDLWNETAARCGLPKAKILDDARRKAIRKRLESGGLDVWRQAMTAVEASAFLRGLRPGSDGRAFKADLGFVCQAKSFARLVDGGYGQDAPPPAAAPAKPPDPNDPWRSRMREFQRNGYWPSYEGGAKPGRPGCLCPPAVLAEFGVQQEFDA